MSPVVLIVAATEHAGGLSPFIPAGIALALFTFLGVVVWSYRDVANRQGKKSSNSSSDSHGSGH
jgi:hypothetical protein